MVGVVVDCASVLELLMTWSIKTLALMLLADLVGIRFYFVMDFGVIEG